MKFFWTCLMMTSMAVSATFADDDRPQAGKQVAQSIDSPLEAGRKLRYWLFLPNGYEPQGDRKWPVILFLHGAGESGTDLEVVKKHGPPKLVGQAPEKYPFIIVSPQAWNEKVHYGVRWDVKELTALLDEINKNYKTDEDRVYLTGLSMGGFGTWRLAAAEPQRFAAIAPVCGGGKLEYAPALKSLPIWAFHGDKDTVVPPERSEEMVKAIKEAGGDPKFTVYPGVGHDSWTETYNNPELYKWFLKHKRSKTAE